jgi:hypothetical protein
MVSCRQCAPLIPDFGLLKLAFDDAEITRYRVCGDHGRTVEFIESFIDRHRPASIGFTPVTALPTRATAALRARPKVELHG